MSSLIIAAGQRLDAAGTRDAFGALSDDLVKAGLPPITVNFGDRDMTEEITLFTTRYRQQATGSGKFGDVRTWDGSAYGFPGGTRWVRVSADGTVATPGSSNHGKKRSGDLAAPYNADTPAHRAAEKLAEAHSITCEGMGFREWWHWTYWGPLGVIGSPAAESATPFTPIKKRKLTMDEALIVEQASNNMVIVNVKDRTLVNLGNDPKSQLRAWFAENMPYKFMGSDEWTSTFGPGTGYNYVGHGTSA